MLKILYKFLLKLENLKLEQKLLLATFCINVLLIGGIMAFGISMVSTRYDHLLYQSLSTSSNMAAYEFSSRLEEMEQLSNIIRADGTIQSVLGIMHNPYATERISYYSQIYSALQQHYLEYKHDYIQFAAISCNRFVAYTYGYLQYHPSDDELQRLITLANEADGSIYWATDIEDNAVFLVRQIKKIKNLELDNLGTLIIKIDLEDLIHEIAQVCKETDSYWILYENNNLLYKPEVISSEELIRIGNQIENYGIVDIQGEKYFAVRAKMESNQWEYIHLLRYEDIAASKKHTTLVHICLLIFSLLLSIIIMHVIMKKVIRHFNLLIERMKQFGEDSGVLQPSDYDYSHRTDEIGMLHRHFEYMAKKIQTLVIEDYKKEILVRDAQLKSLESQINPHFLYNTLESINWRAKAIGEKEISEIVESLGSFLRMTLKKEENFSLREECNVVQYYMTIQQHRFDNRLNFQMDIPEIYMNAKIPKLSLQPLVENAVHYALEQITDDCSILLSCKAEADILELSVKNTGSEFEENLLEKLRNHEIQENGLGIALLNIEERIHIMFGSEYGLSFSNDNDYAIATIKIPYLSVTEDFKSLGGTSKC